MDPLIRVDAVSQVFGLRDDIVHALDEVSLEIGTNEFVTLVGRSGCGKSTLLRLIAGLITPSRGSITIAGTPVTGPRRDVAMVFQRPALLPWRNVIDNVLLPIEVMKLDKRTYRREAGDLLDLVGLTGFEKRQPHELSGGMQQRVALCRSLIYKPKVLLMDEPFAALDALTREELSLELQRIFADHRTTIVFVTHSITEAVLLADRVAVMTPRPGRIAEIVNVDLARPRTLGEGEQSAERSRATAHLHELLFAPASAFEREPTVP